MTTFRTGGNFYTEGQLLELYSNDALVVSLSIDEIYSPHNARVSVIGESELFPAYLQNKDPLYVESATDGLYLYDDAADIPFGPFSVTISVDADLGVVVKERLDELAPHFSDEIALASQVACEFKIQEEVSPYPEIEVDVQQPPEWLFEMADRAMRDKERIDVNPRQKYRVEKRFPYPVSRKRKAIPYSRRSGLQSYVIKVYDRHGSYPIVFMGEDLSTGRAIVVKRIDQASQFGSRAGAANIAADPGTIGTYQHFMYEEFEDAPPAHNIVVEVVPVPTSLVQKNPRIKSRLSKKVRADVYGGLSHSERYKKYLKHKRYAIRHGITAMRPKMIVAIDDNETGRTFYMTSDPNVPSAVTGSFCSDIEDASSFYADDTTDLDYLFDNIYSTLGMEFDLGEEDYADEEARARFFVYTMPANTFEYDESSRAYDTPSGIPFEERRIKENPMSAAKRRSLPARDFIFPENRTWPIQDEAHAMRALSFSTWPRNRDVACDVQERVKARYPNVWQRFKGKRFIPCK